MAGFATRTNFWIPLWINPEQESLWFDLLSEDAKAGELRLQRHRTSWELHVTVEYPVEEPTDPDNPTHIGFDVGESALITGCALKRDAPRNLMLVSGSRARHLRKEMFTNRRLHAWAFARLQGRIEDKAAEAGIRVEYVNAAYTSQTCHACGRLGQRSQQAEFVCPHDDCHVSEFQADITAAANIAGRVDPWGESVPWEPDRDDSPQDVSACDSATVHREMSPKTGQMTLSTYSN